MCGVSCVAELELRVEFLDSPPYKHSWLPWVNDHFRIETAPENKSDSTVVVERATPCNDCSPKFHLETVESGVEPRRLREADVLYIVSDRFFVNLQSGEISTDTIDICESTEYDLDKDMDYQLWLRYGVWPGLEFIDGSRTKPIRTRTLISDTLTLTYRVD